MVLEVLVIAVVVASASAHVVVLPGGVSSDTGHAFRPPAVYVQRRLLVSAPRHGDADLLVTYANQTHNMFINSHNVTAHDHYTTGYELYDLKTGVAQGQSESRYDEVAVGEAYRVNHQGVRTTIQYTVDTTHGFQASVGRVVQTHPMFYGYGRLDYLSYPALRIILSDDAVQSPNPLVQAAYRNRKNVVDYFHLEPPYSLSWEFQIEDTRTGRARGQQETYHDDTAEGRYTEYEADGTHVSIDYTVKPRGIAVTTPNKHDALVHTRLYL